MARQVASVLDAVHAKGIIHRDIKPGNIVVDPTTAKAVVLDFGIARLENSQLTGASVHIGTPGFTSPEQCIGSPVAASDQWSLAACFYTVLTKLRPGLKPGEEERLSWEDAVGRASERIGDDEVLAFSDVPKVVEVPRPVEEAIAKAMSHSHADRFPSVMAFVEAMQVGDVDGTGPVLVDESTEAALSPRHGGDQAAEVETPIALEAPTPLLLGTRRAAERVQASETAADSVPSVPTEEVHRPTVPRYLAAVSSFGILMALGAYLIWGRGGPSAGAAEVKHETESSAATPELSAALPGSTSADAARSDASDPSALREIRVLALHEGKQVDGLSLRVGHQTGDSPLLASLPIGATLVQVTSPQYGGTYPCRVATDSSECELLLVERALPGKQESPRHRRSRRAAGKSKSLLRFVDKDGKSRLKPGEKNLIIQHNTDSSQ